MSSDLKIVLPLLCRTISTGVRLPRAGTSLVAQDVACSPMRPATTAARSSSCKRSKSARRSSQPLIADQYSENLLQAASPGYSSTRMLIMSSAISKYGHKITMAATGQSLGDAPVSGHCNPDLPPNAALGVPKNSRIPDTATEWVSCGYPQKPQCHSSSFDPVSRSAQMFARLPGRAVSRM